MHNSMKKFKCYDCEAEFQAATRDEILNTLYDHYMKNHHDVIAGASDEEKKRWMEQFETDWEAAEDLAV